ncbi:predicted protein [Botrytis cinerea T4]|uniref:Uncharacterized protein n=1 Tax=Botryotinia fuckeliana (strain T4) TaxID=999810 RepID=G2YGX1_BOTF4|nr:predicted protein [Botrytis cinerea T4]
MIYQNTFTSFKSFPFPRFDGNSTLKLKLTPSIFKSRNTSIHNQTTKKLGRVN